MSTFTSGTTVYDSVFSGNESYDDSTYNDNDIFEFNINDEDEDISSISTSIPDSPLLAPYKYINSNYHHQPQYYNYYAEEDSDEEFNSTIRTSGQSGWLYECCICKMKTSEVHHKCVEATNESSNYPQQEDSINYNNELIQSNYRKWLFSISPN
ncbi:hypothetical protein DFJ63DRAFT_311957 [Scheffersomyces coipomensis]|uniref:uncharacterized protein n=1 Tax=Scheffersomyces coipomensis TaxID=1788519 RepID=UPI00315CEB84